MWIFKALLVFVGAFGDDDSQDLEASLFDFDAINANDRQGDLRRSILLDNED